jgi:hypothetical protein
MKPKRFSFHCLCLLLLMFFAPFVTLACAEEAPAPGDRENDGAELSGAASRPALDLNLRTYDGRISGSIDRAIKRDRFDPPAALVPEENYRVDRNHPIPPPQTPTALPQNEARSRAIDRLRDQYFGGFGRLESKSGGSKTRFDYIRSDKCKIRGWGVCLTIEN